MFYQGDIFITAAVRTAIGKFGGSLASKSAADLGTAAAAEALRRAAVPAEAIDEAIFGCARQAGVGPNVARQIAFRAGLPVSVPAFTVNKACGSGLKAIILAHNEIRLGNASAVLAGGTESMSRVPYVVEGARWGIRLGHQQLVDLMYRDGFLDPLCGLVMGETAENLVERYRISRREQDEFALGSQQKAEAAIKSGRFKDEIVPIELTDSRGRTSSFDQDEHVRFGTSLDALAKLPPVFKSDGSITAGNSSGITDGAAAMLVLSEEKARELGVEPLARIVDYTIAGVEPEIMGIGPVPAIRKLFARQKITFDDIDLVELNEAFAAQVIACGRELHIPAEKLNVNGGAIALGHPIGCSGARIVVTLLHEMAKRRARRGLATLCISGGMGIALLVERV